MFKGGVMSEKSVRGWYAGLAIAGAIVAAVAGLLVTIIAVAHGILANASRALSVADTIVDSTQPIWDLEQTNAAAAQLLDEARAIEQHASAVAEGMGA
jgi:hypothetical protein